MRGIGSRHKTGITYARDGYGCLAVSCAWFGSAKTRQLVLLIRVIWNWTAFLLEDACGYQSERLSTTYLVYVGNDLAGFVTWAADAIRLDETEKTHFLENKARLHEFPAIKIARLAVKQNWQRTGMRRLLVRSVPGLMIGWGDWFGCRFATVDAKPDAIGFYENKDLHETCTNRKKAVKPPACGLTCCTTNR